MNAERASCPYVGPRPFELSDRDVFFGRDREVDDLLSLIVAHRAMLLYAESGAGKTSLLNAGLVPQLEREGFEVLPSARVFGLIPRDVDSKTIPNPYVLNVLLSWGMPLEAVVQESGVRLADYLDKLDCGEEATPRVVILDQLEELFTSYPDRWKDRRPFVEQVREALNRDPLLRVVFAIREDFIAQLVPVERFLPERLRTRYRLERLRKPAALQAILGPLDGTDRSFGDGVAEKLVDDLMSLRVEAAPGETTAVEGQFVEPVQLQVVCQELWEHLPVGVKTITRAHVEEFGDADQALSAFYEQRIAQASRAAKASVRRLRRWFERVLITPAGTRGTVYRGKAETGGLKNTAVDNLESSHIIRGEVRAGARWYELTHDRFIGPIRASNASWARCRRRLGAAAALAVAGVTAMAVLFAVQLAQPAAMFADVSLQDEAGTVLYSSISFTIANRGSEPIVPTHVFVVVWDAGFLDTGITSLPLTSPAPIRLSYTPGVWDVELSPGTEEGTHAPCLGPVARPIAGGESAGYMVLLRNDASVMKTIGLALYCLSVAIEFSDGHRLQSDRMLVSVPTFAYPLIPDFDFVDLLGSEPEGDEGCHATNRGTARAILERGLDTEMSSTVARLAEILAVETVSVPAE